MKRIEFYLTIAGLAALQFWLAISITQSQNASEECTRAYGEANFKYLCYKIETMKNDCDVVKATKKYIRDSMKDHPEMAENLVHEFEIEIANSKQDL